MFAQYFEYYTIILRGRFFVDTLYLTVMSKKRYVTLSVCDILHTFTFSTFI